MMGKERKLEPINHLDYRSYMRAICNINISHMQLRIHLPRLRSFRSSQLRKISPKISKVVSPKERE